MVQPFIGFISQDLFFWRLHLAVSIRRQGRPAPRSVAHPLRERVPAAKHCALMLCMSMAAMRFQRG